MVGTLTGARGLAAAAVGPAAYCSPTPAAAAAREDGGVSTMNYLIGHSQRPHVSAMSLASSDLLAYTH